MDMITTLCLGLAIVALLLAPVAIGPYLLRRGHYAKALPGLRRRYRLSAIGALRRLRGTTANDLCVCYIGLGDIPHAMVYGEEAVQETGKQGQNAPLHVLAKFNLALALALLGEFERAEILFDELIMVSSLQPRLRARIECWAANAYVNCGRFEEAIRLLDKALQPPTLSADLRVVGEISLSQCFFFRGNLADALAISRQAMERTTRNPALRNTARAAYLFHLTEAGNIAEAKTVEEALLPGLPTMSPHQNRMALSAIARLALANGDLDRARHNAEQAYPQRANPNAQANSLLIQAEVFAARHSTVRADAICEEILRLKTIDFYKVRASDLRRRLRADGPQAVVKERDPRVPQPDRFKA